MPLESLKARILMFLDEATDAPEDGHDLQERLREHLMSLRGMGLPVPQDLADLEHALASELGQKSHGPKPPTHG